MFWWITKINKKKYYLSSTTADAFTMPTGVAAASNRTMSVTLAFTGLIELSISMPKNCIRQYMQPMLSCCCGSGSGRSPRYMNLSKVCQAPLTSKVNRHFESIRTLGLNDALIFIWCQGGWKGSVIVKKRAHIKQANSLDVDRRRFVIVRVCLHKGGVRTASSLNDVSAEVVHLVYSLSSNNFFAVLPSLPEKDGRRKNKQGNRGITRQLGIPPLRY